MQNLRISFYGSFISIYKKVAYKISIKLKKKSFTFCNVDNKLPKISNDNNNATKMQLEMPR